MSKFAGEIAANRANWDERVAGHLHAYGVEDFIADSGALSGVVRSDVEAMRSQLPGNSPEGLSLVHLQCHIGMDTLSWARLGAEVTGVDLSPKSVEAARAIAERAGLDGRFVVSSVDQAADVLKDQFDVVYTGIGALMWLPDLEEWAGVVAKLLRPGGLFYVREAHPILSALDDERTDGELALTRPYFGSGGATRYDDGTTYADPNVRLHNAVTYEWTHSVSEIIEALLGAGLTLTSFREQTTIPWQALPHLVRVEDAFALPTGRDRLPLTFSITATH